MVKNEKIKKENEEILTKYENLQRDIKESQFIIIWNSSNIHYL